jgi:hypothetical protein
VADSRSWVRTLAMVTVIGGLVPYRSCCLEISTMMPDQLCDEHDCRFYKSWYLHSSVVFSSLPPSFLPLLASLLPSLHRRRPSHSFFQLFYIHFDIFIKQIKMRFSILATSLIMAYTSVNAAPQAYGYPLFAPPRPVPGSGITIPSPVKAPQAPRPAPPAPPANPVNALPAIPSPDPSATVLTSAAVFSPTSSAPAVAAPTIPIPPPNPGNTAPTVQVQACAADVDRLASGIQQNILDQQGEQVTAQGLLLFLQATTNGTRNGMNATTNGNTASPGNTTAPAATPDRNLGLFMALKGQLLAFVTAGVAIRAGNQAIAPPGSLAANGLAQVCCPFGFLFLAGWSRLMMVV